VFTITIANQNVPAKLLNKEVYLLDMTAVIAGTQFRGQFESRMKGIIDEALFENMLEKIEPNGIAAPEIFEGSSLSGFCS